MSALRKAGRFGPRVAVAALAIALVVVSLSGCGGIKYSGGGPRGTGDAPDAQERAVPADVRSQVVEAMKAADVTTSNEAYLFMEYSSEATGQIVVTGEMNGSNRVVLSEVNGKWTVTSK